MMMMMMMIKKKSKSETIRLGLQWCYSTPNVRALPTIALQDLSTRRRTQDDSMVGRVGVEARLRKVPPSAW